MKKTICIILFLLSIFVFVGKSVFANQVLVDAKTTQDKQGVMSSNLDVKEALSNKLIRFHVIANSDSVEDQTLKLKVRDSVLEYISPKLKKSNSIEESRAIIKKEDKGIRDLALKVIKANGFDYKIDTTLSRENFPVKSYGSITLPQGEYEAYRILIGNGKGQNWWCVMFPPLCFVDITKSDTSNKETENEMKKVLNDKEYKFIDNSKANEESAEVKTTKDIKIKFKLVEIIKSFRNKAK
jgi:stage II sporulation protein R